MHVPNRRPDAVARMHGDARGMVRFWQLPDSVFIEAQILGLPRTETGFFAFHIHDSAAGGHYNPTASPHPHHAGDLPPLLSCGAAAYLAVRTNRFRLREILGRTAVIHQDPDDFHTQPAGNPGPKLAQGTICPR